MNSSGNMFKSSSSANLFKVINARPSSVRKFRTLSSLVLCVSGVLFSCSLLFRVLPEPVSVHENLSIILTNRELEPDLQRKKESKEIDDFKESVLGEFKHAAVSVDSEPCAKVANDVLLRGGNAFDSAVAAMYCNSVINSQSMGLGGGFLMVMTLKNGTRFALNARETAPAAASKNMYNGNKTLTHFGPIASGVPGFVAGTWELKQRLGNPEISWRSLLQPAIDFCFNGITVNQHAAFFGKKVARTMKQDPSLVEIFFNKETNKMRSEGEVYTFPSLGHTLKRIARKGAADFYGGTTGQRLIRDIKKAGGIITLKDLKDYKPVWEEPISYQLKNKEYTLVTSPPPGSGAITAAILGVMDLYNPAPRDLHQALTWHRFAEASKYGFARKTHLADWNIKSTSHEVHGIIEDITSDVWREQTKMNIDDEHTFQDPGHYGAKYSVVEDHGTCHMNFLDAVGNAVSVTASINLIYGAKYMSRSTGVVMNNQMDDFGNPGIVSAYNLQPSPNNYIHPGKRPMSSMSTTIVLDKTGRVIAIAGASGGTKIITATAQVLLRMLYLGQNVKEAIDEPRLHHQLLPMELWHEQGISSFMLGEMERIGHNLTFFKTGGSAVQAILVDQETGLTTANADYRKGGAVYGF